MSTFNTTLYRLATIKLGVPVNSEFEVEEEFDIVVEYTIHPGSRGHRDKYGCPEEPDEDPWVEIEEVTRCDNGTTIELTTKESTEIEDKIWSDNS